MLIRHRDSEVITEDKPGNQGVAAIGLTWLSAGTLAIQSFGNGTQDIEGGPVKMQAPWD
jgi:hypothetical protein